jgi:hypothetical protein
LLTSFSAAVKKLQQTGSSKQQRLKLRCHHNSSRSPYPTGVVKTALPLHHEIQGCRQLQLRTHEETQYVPSAHKPQIDRTSTWQATASTLQSGSHAPVDTLHICAKAAERHPNKLRCLMPKAVRDVALNAQHSPSRVGPEAHYKPAVGVWWR